MPINREIGFADTYIFVSFCYRDRLVAGTIVKKKNVSKAHLNVVPDEMLDVELAVLDYAGYDSFVAR